MVLDAGKLIRLVQERRSLWCHASPNYKNLKLKKLLWEEIGRKLNVSAITAKTKWRSLRDVYARQCSAMNQSSGSGRTFVRWRFYHDMAFIKEELYTRKDIKLQPLTEETFEVTYLDEAADPLVTPPMATANEDPILTEDDDVAITAENHYCTPTDNGMTEMESGTYNKVRREHAIRNSEDRKSTNYYFLNSLVDPLDSLPLEVQLHIKEQYIYLLHSALRTHNDIGAVNKE